MEVTFPRTSSAYQKTSCPVDGYRSRLFRSLAATTIPLSPQFYPVERRIPVKFRGVLLQQEIEDRSSLSLRLSPSRHHHSHGLEEEVAEVDQRELQELLVVGLLAAHAGEERVGVAEILLHQQPSVNQPQHVYQRTARTTKRSSSLLYP